MIGPLPVVLIPLSYTFVHGVLLVHLAHSWYGSRSFAAVFVGMVDGFLDGVHYYHFYSQSTYSLPCIPCSELCTSIQIVPVILHGAWAKPFSFP